MSLSKLGSTSGASSQIAFDGQNPFSEKQHPLLLPVVLDNLFSYLNFSEVKSNRLVCKAWNEIGISFIGRRKLKPLKFSDVDFEDFLALRKEFEDPTVPHPKRKLFQGFSLHWVDVVTMAYCNFMPLFKPSELVISGNYYNDPTSLRNLLRPIISTLKDLTLEIHPGTIPACYFSFDLLRDLVELGMTLKTLFLEILKVYEADVAKNLGKTQSQDGSICRNLSNLLQNQAPFLEILVLMIIGSDKRDSKIQFPVFPRLIFLCLNLKLKTSLNGTPENFQPFDFCVKFPNLLRLNIRDIELCEMAQEGGTLDMTRGHPLINLKISTSKSFKFPIAWLNKLGISFPFLKEFFTQYLITTGVEIPWADTLRILEIRGTSREFTFLHLKKMEKLHYTLVQSDGVIEDVDGLINRLLEHYHQFPHLEEFHLSGFNVSPEQMILIQEVIPAQFWAILTID